MAGGGVKNYPKFRDVIYGRPLFNIILAITLTDIQMVDLEFSFDLLDILKLQFKPSLNCWFVI